MSTMHENLARAQMTARLGEAQQMRIGHELTRAHRVSRRAQRAVRQGRMAPAQAL